ncbi:unnamed protein product [Protopolystoma xenopodis]|uniref:Uncharacterized protein n=1 Tax=Protopolystoma xenopodis TaxID=117903 RepID=A0A448W9W9_9PLAT|nr:unnamed protein product [Protopolystoma xenopodis]
MQIILYFLSRLSRRDLYEAWQTDFPQTDFQTNYYAHRNIGSTNYSDHPIDSGAVKSENTVNKSFAWNHITTAINSSPRSPSFSPPSERLSVNNRTWQDTRLSFEQYHKDGRSISKETTNPTASVSSGRSEVNFNRVNSTLNCLGPIALNKENKQNGDLILPSESENSILSVPDIGLSVRNLQKKARPQTFVMDNSFAYTMDKKYKVREGKEHGKSTEDDYDVALQMKTVFDHSKNGDDSKGSNRKEAREDKKNKMIETSENMMGEEEENERAIRITSDQECKSVLKEEDGCILPGVIREELSPYLLKELDLRRAKIRRLNQLISFFQSGRPLWQLPSELAPALVRLFETSPVLASSAESLASSTISNSTLYSTGTSIGISTGTSIGTSADTTTGVSTKNVPVHAPSSSPSEAPVHISKCLCNSTNQFEQNTYHMPMCQTCYNTKSMAGRCQLHEGCPHPCGRHQQQHCHVNQRSGSCSLSCHSLRQVSDTDNIKKLSSQNKKEIRVGNHLACCCSLNLSPTNSPVTITDAFGPRVDCLTSFNSVPQSTAGLSTRSFASASSSMTVTPTMLRQVNQTNVRSEEKLNQQNERIITTSDCIPDKYENEKEEEYKEDQKAKRLIKEDEEDSTLTGYSVNSVKKLNTEQDLKIFINPYPAPGPSEAWNSKDSECFIKRPKSSRGRTNPSQSYAATFSNPSVGANVTNGKNKCQPAPGERVEPGNNENDWQNFESKKRVKLETKKQLATEAQGSNSARCDGFAERLFNGFESGGKIGSKQWSLDHHKRTSCIAHLNELHRNNFLEHRHQYELRTLCAFRGVEKATQTVRITRDKSIDSKDLDVIQEHISQTGQIAKSTSRSSYVYGLLGSGLCLTDLAIGSAPSGKISSTEHSTTNNHANSHASSDLKHPSKSESGYEYGSSSISLSSITPRSEPESETTSLPFKVSRCAVGLKTRNKDRDACISNSIPHGAHTCPLKQLFHNINEINGEESGKKSDVQVKEETYSTRKIPNISLFRSNKPKLNYINRVCTLLNRLTNEISAMHRQLAFLTQMKPTIINPNSSVATAFESQNGVLTNLSLAEFPKGSQFSRHVSTPSDNLYNSSCCHACPLYPNQIHMPNLPSVPCLTNFNFPPSSHTWHQNENPCKQAQSRSLLCIDCQCAYHMSHSNPVFRSNVLPANNICLCQTCHQQNWVPFNVKKQEKSHNLEHLVSPRQACTFFKPTSSPPLSHHSLSAYHSPHYSHSLPHPASSQHYYHSSSHYSHFTPRPHIDCNHSEGLTHVYTSNSTPLMERDHQHYSTKHFSEQVLPEKRSCSSFISCSKESIASGFQVGTFPAVDINFSNEGNLTAQNLLIKQATSLRNADSANKVTIFKELAL